jgi:hypothetical protein
LSSSQHIRDTLAARGGARGAWLPPEVPPLGQTPRSDDEMLAVCSDLAEHRVGPEHHELGAAVIAVRFGPLLETVDTQRHWRCQIVCTGRFNVPEDHYMAWGVVAWSAPADGSWQRPRVHWSFRGAPGANQLDDAIVAFNASHRRKLKEREKDGQHRWVCVEHESDLNVVTDNLTRAEVAMALSRLARRTDGRRGPLLGVPVTI